MEYPSAFVSLMGMGTVFFGLICIVALCCLMSAVSAALAEELGTDISGIRILSLKKLEN